MPITLAIIGGTAAIGGGIFGGMQMRKGMKQQREGMSQLEDLMANYPQYKTPGQVGKAEDLARAFYEGGLPPELLEMIKMYQESNKRGMTAQQGKVIDVSERAYKQGAGPVNVGPAYSRQRAANAYNQAAGLGQVARGATSTADMMAAMAVANQQGLAAGNELATQEALAYTGEQNKLRDLNQSLRQDYLGALTEGGRQGLAIQEGYGSALKFGADYKMRALDSYLQQLGISAEALNNEYMMAQMNPWLAKQNMAQMKYAGGQQTAQAGMNLLGQSFGTFGQSIGMIPT
jgi:hypothetical protein